MNTSETSRQPAPCGVSPAAAEAFNAANRAARSGDHGAAIASCERAITLAPDLVQAHVLLARSHVALAQTDAAVAAYRAALAIDSAEFSASLELGNILRHLGHLPEAVACYHTAISSRPRDSRGHLALALLCQDPQVPDAAYLGARHYHLATGLFAPGADAMALMDLHHKIALRRMSLGNVAGAVDAYRAALAALPASGTCPDAEAEMRADCAAALLRLDLEGQAIEMLEHAARATGAAALRKVADLCYHRNLWQEAIAILRRALGFHPGDVEVTLALASLQASSWLLGDAQDTLDGIADCLEDRHHLAAGELRARIAYRTGDVETAIDAYEAVLPLDPEGIAASLAMTVLSSDARDPQEWCARNRAAFAGWGEGARDAADFPNDATPDRPLRIGMVSADLHRQHPVMIFMQPMFAHWDQQQYPLFVYDTGKVQDEETRLARSRVPAWRTLSPDQLPQAVAADRIDILIDLAGHTHAAELRQFARRMAPVQASYLGFPGSTGVPNIDWYIADTVSAPPQLDHLFSERVMRLETAVFCYAPEADYPLPLFTSERASRPLTFGSFNNVSKYSARTLDLWARILREVPDSRLVLKAPSFKDAGTVGRFRQQFEDRGIAAARLDLREPSALPDMMAEYGDIDIALDPMPYNGGTTTAQALWMGVPVITREGRQFVSRMGASLLSHAGMTDWIAASDEEYVRIALAWAGDRERLLDLKRGLRARLQASKGWDIEAHVLEVERCLRRMWIEST